MVSSLDNWDGSCSGALNLKTPRISDLLDTSTLNKTTTIQDERAGHGWQDSYHSLDTNNTNDASNLNEPLPRDGLVQRPPTSSMLSIVTSKNGSTASISMPARKTLSFSRVVSSTLHNKQIGLPSVAPTSILLTIPDPIISEGRSFLMDLAILDNVSTYTADGEGEEEDAEVEEVTDILSKDSVMTSRTYHEQNISHPIAASHHSSLFTPSEEDSQSVGPLFTPCPSPKQTLAEPSRIYCRPHSRRLLISHIEVPRLKRPPSDYHPFTPAHSTVVVPSGPYRTLQEALQASSQLNADIGVPPYGSLERKKQKQTKRNKDREEDNVAGPSSVAYPDGHVFHFGSVNAAENEKKLKRSFPDDVDDDWGAPPRSKIPSRPIAKSAVLDLTITDDERVRGPKVKPAPKIKPKSISKPLPKPRPAKKSKFIHAAYNSETDVLTMCLEDIRPVPLEVVTLNTRYLRQSLSNNVNANKEVSALGPEAIKSAKFNINRTRQNGSRPCFLSIAANPSLPKDTGEEMSVGGVVWELPEEEVKKEVIEISSESNTSLKENVPQRHAYVPSLPTPQVLPSNPNLRSSLGGQNLDPDDVMPSAKALGKRRAVSPSISAPATPHRHLHFPVPAFFAASIRDLQLSSRRLSIPIPTPDPYVVHSDFNTFIDYPLAVQSSSSQVNGADLSPLDSFASLYDLSSLSPNKFGSHIGSDMDMDISHQSNTQTPTHSHYNSQLPGPGSRKSTFFSSPDSLYNALVFPGDQDHQYLQEQHNAPIDHPWSSSLVANHSENQYAYETIDPTLLGGGGEASSVVEAGLGEFDRELDAAGMGLEFETGFHGQVQEKDIVGSEQSSPSSSADSSSSTRRKKTYSSLASSSDNYASVDDKEHGKEKTYARKLPPRKRTKRVMPDMISHDDMDLLLSMGSKRSKRRFLSSSASSGPDVDTSGLDLKSDDDKPSVRKPIPKPKAQIPSKQSRTRSISESLIEQKVTVSRGNKNQNFPMDDVDSSCHQCRNRTFYAKMTCSSCQKRFCVRCYEFRYPECEFDANAEEYSCPACEGFCNCTSCSRKRGEPYVGVRTCDPVPNSPPLPPKRPRNTNVERVELGGKTNLPPPATIPIPKGATQAWGSLYSLTGEKIGACYFDPTAENDTSMVFAPPTTPLMANMTQVASQVATMTTAPKDQPKTRAKKRRIFVGMVQPCWGYTRPKIRPLKPEPYTKRFYNEMPRYYIGKKKYLFYPVEEDDTLAPADSTDEVVEPDGIDLEGKSFSLDSLGEGDIARAIVLGLNACGVAAVEVPAI